MTTRTITNLTATPALLLAAGMVFIMWQAPAVGAIVEDNTGYDQFFTGPWSDAGTNFSGWQDNIEGQGDDGIGGAWWASNGQKMIKAPYGPSEDPSVVNNPGFAGVFRGAVGDIVAATYSFTAADAITEQGWIVKAIISRLHNRDAALDLRVQVNGGGFTTVDTSSTFFSSGSSGDIFVDFPEDGMPIDGPTETRVADLSFLGIQAGDEIDYRITYASGRHIGLGVQFIPEPTSLALLGAGGLLMLRRQRRVAS